MPLGQDYAGQACSIARALEVVGERWTLLVLRDCFYGVRRFSDLQRRLGLPKAVLSARLETLVTAGVLVRERRDGGRVEYRLTEDGQALWPVLHALYAWGERHARAGRGRRRVFRHASCDTELDVRGACPACGTLPSASEVDVHPGPDVLSEPDTDEPVDRALRVPHRLLEPLP